MSGLSGRGPARDAEAGPAAQPEKVAASSSGDAAGETVPPIETAVPTAAVPSGPLGSRTLLAGGAPAQTPPPAEPTAPSTLQTFQDGSADEAESSPVAAASGG